MECSICRETITDKVSMTCSSQHPFCFKCLLQDIETNSELKNCPNCRGGDKFIMLSNEVSTTTDFYSLIYFKKSLPILQKILEPSIIVNSCLIPENILILYVKNKKQLEMAHKLIALGETIDSVISTIKWDEKRSLEEVGIEMMGGLAELFGLPVLDNRTFGTNPFGTNPRNEGPRVVFASTTTQQPRRREF